MPEITVNRWDEFIQARPDAHLLQTSDWGRLKAAFGWKAAYLLADVDRLVLRGAQVLLKPLPLGWRMAYIAKGPVTGDRDRDWTSDLWGGFWGEVDEFCRRHQVAWLLIEPDCWEEEIPAHPPGFSLATVTIQPRRTLLVDLSSGEPGVLARMKQKTRYNIRLAQKKGVQVSPSQDLDTFHRLMSVTGARDAFGVHTLDYYRQAYQLFHPQVACELFIASFQDEPLAGLMVFARGRRAWYFYGASADVQRDLMPSYLLQWQAMVWAMQRGCEEYDLWGTPDEDEATLESNFTQRSDGLWGVYRFKRGFGGELRRAAGPFERIYQPGLHVAFRWWSRLRNGQGE